jgi:hypothetical protein
LAILRAGISSTLQFVSLSFQSLFCLEVATARARDAEFFQPSDKFHLGAAVRAVQNVFSIRARVSDLLHNNRP